MIMKCNQICKWNSNAGCVKPYGVPCILENVSPTGRKATNSDRFRAMSDKEQQSFVRGFWEIEDFADWLQQPAKGE